MPLPMIYGLETETGCIYTEEEWWDTYKDVLPDYSVVMDCFSRLPKLDVDPTDLQEIRKKMAYIYAPSLPRMGDIIISPFSEEKNRVVGISPLYTTHLKSGLVKK